MIFPCKVWENNYKKGEFVLKDDTDVFDFVRQVYSL